MTGSYSHEQGASWTERTCVLCDGDNWVKHEGPPVHKPWCQLKDLERIVGVKDESKQTNQRDVEERNATGAASSVGEVESS